MIRRILLRWAPGYRWAILYPALTACGASQPAPPCDSATVAAKLAECVALVQSCQPAPAPCYVYDACIAWIEDREARCVR